MLLRLAFMGSGENPTLVDTDEFGDTNEEEDE